MSRICPYCGTENYLDDRIGRREPRCRICGEERITAEELKKKKDRSIGNIERELTKLRERAEGNHEKMFSVQESILELEQERDGYKEELEELKAESAPLEVGLAEWNDVKIFYEKRDRAFMAERDPHQAKLPFEVPV